MGRFHAPADEKRSIVAIEPDQQQPWLHARSDAEALALLRAADHVCRPDLQKTPVLTPLIQRPGDAVCDRHA